MAYALMSSGGKDSTLALDRARRADLDVRYLVTIYDTATERVRFHGVRIPLIRAHAHALELEPVTAESDPDTFEPVFLQLLNELRAREVQGIIFGNVHLTDVRAWYEERVTAAGLKHVEPLWGEPPIELAWEIVERGYYPLVVSVDASHEAKQFLGRQFDADLVVEMGCLDDFDPCGERGEFHSFVYDGPEFRQPVQFSVGDQLELDGHQIIDLVAPAD